MTKKEEMKRSATDDEMNNDSEIKKDSETDSFDVKSTDDLNTTNEDLEDNDSPETDKESNIHSSCNIKIKELTDMLKRLQADFENYKKRVESQRADLIAESTRKVLSEIIPVLDNFEIALQHADKSSKEDMISGFRMIYANLEDTLKKNGLEEIDAHKKDFNPFEHEAIMQEESDEDDDKVIGIFQKGYRLNKKVIRHAKVKLSKKRC
jgi:molecular chaperone GrpE